jgi:hypothetical protein
MRDTTNDAASGETFAQRHAGSILAAAALAMLLALPFLAGCGGGSTFGNPPTVDNPLETGGRKLSFVYFQKCINPVFLAQLRINQNGQISTNTCAAGGCHDNTSGTGGALRVEGTAAQVDPATGTPDVIRMTDMYRNFYSAQGEVIPGDPLQSRLLNKPLVRNVLHGGGLIFESADDPNAKLIEYWINRPMPQGQDEFSTAANSMFSGNDPAGGTCNTQ